MRTVLHLWLADPSSPSELSTFLAALHSRYPESLGHTRVVYEREELSIRNMAAGFGGGSGFVRALESKAAELGRPSGYALIGAHMSPAVAPETKPSLVYLGAFDPTK